MLAIFFDPMMTAFNMVERPTGNCQSFLHKSLFVFSEGYLEKGVLAGMIFS